MRHTKGVSLQHTKGVLKDAALKMGASRCRTRSLRHTKGVP
jgi:hypothetical protein